MAFLKNSFLAYNCERFNFLYLDPGEIYFESFGIVAYNQDSIKNLIINYKGYLRLCSKSIIFEPDDVKYPLYKVLFKNCNVLDKWHKGTTLFSRQDYSNILLIQSSLVSLISSNCKNEPYKTIKGNHKFIFCLTYCKVDDFLPFVQQLVRSTTLNPADQSLMVNAIVESRLNRAPFDMNWLDDLLSEEIKLIMEANRVLPLVIVPGRIILTAQKLYYQPLHNLNQPPDFKLNLSVISDIWERRFKLKPIGLEIQCNSDPNILIPSSSNRHIYLSFGSQVKRDTFLSILTEMDNVKVKQNENREIKLANLTQSWVQGTLSNFDYLLHLNNLADRSFNDLTQYPVFPWVLSDYTSSKIDLNDEGVYRDLSKPIGALNADRLKRLKTRLNEMLEDGSQGAHGDEIFLYGSHYSTPGFVLYYLVRSAPQHALSLHGGRYDHADRIFHSMAETWSNVLTSASDFKELIPEFYIEPEAEADAASNFLLNHLNLDLGIRHDGTHINHVILPPWAYNSQTSGCKGTALSPTEACVNFFKIMRAALESDIVSRCLPQWIDLIFGYRQNGAAALQADNLFHPLTYEKENCMMASNPFYADECNAHYADENRRRQCETQVLEFGQTPRQLFCHAPHPPKITALLEPLQELSLIEARGQNPIEHEESGQDDNPIPGSRVLKVPEDIKQLSYELYQISPINLTIDDNSSYKISSLKSKDSPRPGTSSCEWVILSAFKNSEADAPKFTGFFLGQRPPHSNLFDSIYHCSSGQEGNCQRIWPIQGQTTGAITALVTNSHDNSFMIASGHSNGTFCVNEYIYPKHHFEAVLQPINSNFTMPNAHEIHCDIIAIAILPPPALNENQSRCLIATAASDYRLKLWYRCPATLESRDNNFDFKYAILTEIDTDSVVHRLSLGWLSHNDPALSSAEFLCSFGNGHEWETHRCHLVTECSKLSNSFFGPTLNTVCQNSSSNVFASSSSSPLAASVEGQFFTHINDKLSAHLISLDKASKPEPEIGRLIEINDYLGSLIVLNKERECLRITFHDFSSDLSVESTRILDDIEYAFMGDKLVETKYEEDGDWLESKPKNAKNKVQLTESNDLSNCSLCQNILFIGTSDGRIVCLDVINTALRSHIQICSNRIVALIATVSDLAYGVDLLVTDEIGCIYEFTLETIEV